jgi:hypothetical protein
MSSTPEADGDDLISLGAAAKVLGINKSTLSRQVRTGQVRSHGGKVRLSEVREDRAKNVRATPAAEQDETAAEAPTSPLHEALHSPLHATKRATARNDATPRATDRATPPADATPIGDVAARVIEQVGGWITLSAAARAAGINKSTLSRQVRSGAIRSQDGKVRLADVLEDRAANINLNRRQRRAQTSLPLPRAPDEAPPEVEGLEANPEDLEVLVDGRVLSFVEAQKRKETYLAKLRQLEFLEKLGTLVSRKHADATFFEVSREARDAWLGWPARVATLMASKLGVEAQLLTETLATYVRQHLDELGEPAAPEFAGSD